MPTGLYKYSPHGAVKGEDEALTLEGKLVHSIQLISRTVSIHFDISSLE
jgi:hypothetical protein